MKKTIVEEMSELGVKFNVIEENNLNDFMKYKSLQILIETENQLEKALPDLTVPVHKKEIETALEKIDYHITNISKPDIVIYDYNHIKERMENAQRITKFFLELNYIHRELIRVSEFIKRIEVPCLFLAHFDNAMKKIENNLIHKTEEIKSLEELIKQGIDFIDNYGSEDQKNTLKSIREGEEGDHFINAKSKEELTKIYEDLMRKNNISEYQINQIKIQVKKKEKLVTKLRQIRKSHNAIEVDKLIKMLTDHKGFLSSKDHSFFKKRIKKIA